MKKLFNRKTLIILCEVTLFLAAFPSFAEEESANKKAVLTKNSKKPKSKVVEVKPEIKAIIKTEEVRPDPAKYISYNEAIEIALHDNPDLLSIRNQEDAFKFRSAQAFAPANPVLSYSKVDIPALSLSQQEAEETYTLSFTLGFPGKAFFQSDSIRHQAEGARELAYSKEIDITNAISNIYISFITNEKNYQLLLEEQKRNDGLVKLLEKKFAASQAAKVDLLNANVATQNISRSILENRNEYDILLTQFRQIIRRPEDKTIKPKILDEIDVPEVKQNFDQLKNLMITNRHAFKYGQKQVESSKSSMEVAALSPFPDIQLNAGINRWNRSSAAPNPGVVMDYTLGISFTIPLFFPFNELPAIRAAHSDVSSAENQMTSQYMQALADLTTYYTIFKAMEKEIEALDKFVLPAAKASYDLNLLTYGLGKSDYFRLNEARKSWLDSKKDYLSKKHNLAQVYNQLISQVGCDFNRSEGFYACK